LSADLGRGQGGGDGGGHVTPVALR
jgi:hypothetical protein